ncbi:MAG: hypothetical protein K6A70_01765 [Erysipelotrichaceae bacterium]|nr:hypothetical protein [Erysipelotrichaceae bacterium]
MAYLKNRVQLSDEILDSISGGSDGDLYQCAYCDAHFKSLVETLEHALVNFADMRSDHS